VSHTCPSTLFFLVFFGILISDSLISSKILVNDGFENDQLLLEEDQRSNWWNGVEWQAGNKDFKVQLYSSKLDKSRQKHRWDMWWNNLSTICGEESKELISYARVIHQMLSLWFPTYIPRTLRDHQLYRKSSILFLRHNTTHLFAWLRLIDQMYE
jgi:hypothetical protein